MLKNANNLRDKTSSGARSKACISLGNQLVNDPISYS